MFGKENWTFGSQAWHFLANGLAQIEFFSQPRRQYGRESAPTARRYGEVGLEHSGKFEDGLVVKDHRIQFSDCQPRLGQA